MIGPIMSQFRMSFLLRILVLLWAVVLVPLPLLAEPQGSSAVPVAEGTLTADSSVAPEKTVPADFPSESDVIVGPAPVLAEPEPVTLRAEFQPAPAEPALHVEEEKQDPSQIDLRSAITMLVDEDSLTFEEAAGRFGEFQPFDGEALLRQSGALWLHLALDNVAHASPGSFRLDLGDQLPPSVEVWLSSDGIRWKLAVPETEGVYSLAYAGDDGQALIRMDGMPGLWFCPVLRPLALALQSPEREAYGMAHAMLGLLSGLCLFLCLGLRGESRFWTFILSAAAAVQTYWAIPATASGIGVSALPGIFAAGVALLMLPHIGRVLMRTRIVSPAADIFFMVLALLGVCAALLPLLSGMAWVARLLILWPLAAVLCALPSLMLLVRGVQGSLPFTLSCFAMGGGALFSLWGLSRGIESPLWGTAVLFGPALGILFLTAASPFRTPQVLSSGNGSEGSPAGTSAEDAGERVLSALRQSVRGTVEELLDEACRLDQALDRVGVDPEHVKVMARADGLVAVARRIAENVMETPAPLSLPDASDEGFDLRRVIQSVFSSLFVEAENKGLGLSWYVAPHLGRRYKGDSARLTALLSLLLSDAVRASSGGAVSLRVRRANSTHPGHLLFSVADTGEGQPPHGRSSVLLSRVWDWASACGGELFVSSGPHGTEIAFSIVCTAYEDDGVTERPIPGEAVREHSRPEEKQGRRNSRFASRLAGRLVIAASSESVSRQMLTHYLGGMGFRVWEACDAAEAAALYAVEPAALVIFDGSLAEDDMVQALASIRMHEGERSLPAVPFLLLARDALQAERISKAGCDEALLPPLVRKDLRAMAKWLTSPAGSMPKPVLSSQRVTLAEVLAGASTGTLRLQRKEKVKGLRAEPEPAAVAEDVHLEKTAAGTVTEEKPQSLTECEPSVEAAPASLSGMPEESVPVSSRTDTEVETSADAVASPAGKDEETAAVTEEDYAPVERIAQGLDAVKAALDELDAYSVRRGSAALAAVAEACGMHTLADMARCFRAAWEEGDLEAAAQIVEEMRAENARNGRGI